MAAGAGYYWAAVFTTALTLFALWPLRLLAFKLVERWREEETRIVVELVEGHSVAPLLERLHDVKQVEVVDERDRRTVTLELEHVDDETVASLSDLEYVIGVRWHR
jgi:uncharacterized membrane protein YhiD involved in acid resistance